jgi:flavin-dependent dehydrogenase
MMKTIRKVVLFGLMPLLGLVQVAKSETVSESERMIPLSYDVDVIVVGGTLRGVAAAEAAAQAGAKVFLITDRPYLGEDVCGTQRLWVKSDVEPKTALGQSIYGASSGAKATENGFRVVTPMDVKRKLDEALLRSKVDYLYGSYVTEVLHDPNGELAGVVVANRSGRQAIRGKVIVDATDRASVARIAGAEFTPYPSGPQKFKRIIVGGKPNPEAKDLGFKYTVTQKVKKKGTDNESYPVYAYELELPMKDGSWDSFVHADKIARDKTYQFGQATYSEKLFQVPPDPVKSRGAHDGAWERVGSIPLTALTPAKLNHLFVLGGCAGVSREAATQLLRPLHSLQWGQIVGQQIAKPAVARPLAPASELVVAGHGGQATIQAEVGDVLTGLRWKSTEGAVRSPARALPVLGRYDTVVVGGGTGGAPAGIGASRAGARTLVIEHLHGLGGVGTLGRISIYYHGNKAGFNAEVEREITALSDEELEPWQGNIKFDIETKMEWLRNEINKVGGEIWYLSLGVGSVVQDKRFTGVVVATPLGRGVILANTVIDSTGNSVIPHCAGLETQMIDHEHISVQGTGLPPWHPGENMRNSDWTFAHDDDVMDMWRIHVVAKKKFKEDYDLGQLIDSRVRRRIYGDVLITPMDILNQRVFPDVITVSSSDFDNHGFSSHDLFMVYRQEREELKGNIPYRALLPKGYDGILVTGLGISGHGDAMPVIRMQRDIENHSYAAGYASAMAARDMSTVRKIDVKELQRHLVDIGTIPESFIGAEDSYPLSPEVIQDAVKRLGRDYSGIEQILTQPEMAIPLMREAYAASAQEEVKLRYAHVLGLLYDDTGAESLLRAVGSRQWDKGWKFKGLGNYGSTTSPLDNLIIALGRTGDERAIPVLIEKAGQLRAKSELSHFRAIAVAFENLRHPDAAKTLAKLLKLPGTGGNSFTGIDKVLKRTPDSHGDNTTREVSLRELILARALYRCGDYQGLGKKTLKAYSNDLRGHYALHARAVLAESIE